MTTLLACRYIRHIMIYVQFIDHDSLNIYKDGFNRISLLFFKKKNNKPFLSWERQSIYGLFAGKMQSGRKPYQLKTEQENVKDAPLSPRKCLKGSHEYLSWI